MRTRKKIGIAVLCVLLAGAAAAGGVAWGMLRGKKEPPKQPPAFETLSSASQNADKADEAALQALLASREPVTWLFAGDSITHGCMHTNYHRNFAELFELYIKTTGSPRRENDFVINTGVSSATTADLMQYFDDWVTSTNPDVAFLCFGMNDCATEGITVEDFRAHLKQTVDALRADGAIPILQTPNASSRQREIEPYLEAVRSLAREEDVLLVDLNAYWSENMSQLKKMMADSIHPNGAGHLLWLRYLLDALNLPVQDAMFDDSAYADVYGPIPSDLLAMAQPPADEAARALLTPYLDNETPVTWVFAGGATTQGVHLAPSERSYIQHFQEVVRWENAGNPLVRRCKKLINAGRDGYTVTDMLRHYDELIGQFPPDVVSIMPEPFDSRGVLFESEDAVFRADLTKLVARAQADGAVVLLQTPFDGSEKAVEMQAAMREIAAEYETALVDQTALFLELSAQGSGAPSLLADPETHTVTAAGQLYLARNLTARVTDVPDDSRIRGAATSPAA